MRSLGALCVREAWIAAAGFALASCAPSIHDTVQREELERAGAMLEADPDLVCARNALGKTPLHYAVTYGKPDFVELFVAHGADTKAVDITGMTPLHVAGMLGQNEEAAILLREGADVNARDAFGDTPLHTAAMHGQTRTMRFLLESGANVSAENRENLTPSMLAHKYHQTRSEDVLKTWTAFDD